MDSYPSAHIPRLVKWTRPLLEGILAGRERGGVSVAAAWSFLAACVYLSRSGSCTKIREMFREPFGKMFPQNKYGIVTHSLPAKLLGVLFLHRKLCQMLLPLRCLSISQCHMFHSKFWQLYFDKLKIPWVVIGSRVRKYCIKVFKKLLFVFYSSSRSWPLQWNTAETSEQWISVIKKQK